MPKPGNDVCSPKSTGASRSQSSGLSQAERGSCDNAIPDESPELHERGGAYVYRGRCRRLRRRARGEEEDEEEEEA